MTDEFHDPFEAQLDELAAQDEANAATQESLQAQRDEIDEALSEEDDDPYAQKREELGDLSLVWWHDHSLFEAFGAMGALFDEMLMNFDRTNALIDKGLPESTMSVQVEANMLTGPIILAGLQLLGLFLPEVRETVEKIIKDFPQPVATEEEEAAIDAAVQAIEDEYRENLKKAAEQLRDEILAHREPVQDTSATDAELGELGLGLN